jgi:hypothetical protein
VLPKKNPEYYTILLTKTLLYIRSLDVFIPHILLLCPHWLSSPIFSPHHSSVLIANNLFSTFLYAF